MADLHWFPFFAEAWLSSKARSKMLPEQRGAYMDLLCYAWGNGEAEPSIAAEDAADLSGLGKRWAKLGALVLAQFTERDGRLYNAKLSEVWNEQQSKHTRAVQRAQKAGTASGLKRNKKSTTSSPQADHIELEEAVETSPKGLALPASAPSGALAPEAPRAPALFAPGSPLARYTPPASDDPDPEEAELRRAYRSRLLELVDEWCRRNPEDTAALDEGLKVELYPPLMRLSPTDAMRRVHRERMIEEVARRNPKWPNEETWCAQQRVRAMEESAA